MTITSGTRVGGDRDGAPERLTVGRGGPRTTPAATTGASTTGGWGRMSWLRAALDRPMTSFHLIVASTGLLLGLGVLMVLSASSVVAVQENHSAYYYVKRQVLFLCVGLLGAVVMAVIAPSRIRVLGWVGLFGACVLLILTYTGLGVCSGGNCNWLRLGPGLLQIQPSEFAKLALIVWSADVLARKEKLLDQPKHLLVPFLPVSALVIALIMFQGDAGTAVVVGGIVAVMLWIVGAPTRVLVGLGLAGGVGVIGLFVTSPNRMARLTAFLNPNHDTGGTNLQSTVAMLAIASGGWWGLGLGASRQKWGSLPVAYSDYIYAVIGEELGLVGSLVVLLLFLLLGYAGIRIALRSTDNFARYASAGVTAWFTLQALINLGVVLRLMPIAGVPLPLVSYGGSALISNLLAIGLLVNCARREPAARELLTSHRARRKPSMTTVVGSRGTRTARTTRAGRRR